MRRLLLGLLAALALAAAALAQETPAGPPPESPRQVQGPPAPAPTNLAQPGSGTPARAGVPLRDGVPDYEAWGTLARRAEAIIAGGSGSGILMENLRAQIAEWRTAFLEAQGANSARIATLKSQIESLGPAPAEGATEAEEIAVRRKDLDEQLTRLQAPVIAAEEAYTRADGLIREIDRILRERQAKALMQLLPMPVNPANWPEAVATAYGIAASVVAETRHRAGVAAVRRDLTERMPTIAGLTLVALLLLWRGRRWFEQWPNRLYERASERGREVWSLLASLGQIVVPVIGIFALTLAIVMTGLPGPVGTELVSTLPAAGLVGFASRWLGLRVFPKVARSDASLRLDAEARRRGRFAATALGLLFAVETLRLSVTDPVTTPEPALSVLAFPGLVLTSVLLFRLGRLLRLHGETDSDSSETHSYRDRLIATLGRAAKIAAVIGPLIGAVGYVAAGTGLVYPMVATLALIATLFLLQKLVADTFVLIAGEGTAREGLLPVLAGFALTIAALPLLALIWGARWSDITEMAARAQGGFDLGGTRISPTSFLAFAVVFALGFLLTRLFQGALKSTVLPKTRLDRGGQNAVVAGTGYLGIFLAALVAINAAGLDLSGLAIVAGALSVGIGFGLQTIVSNFVSGIILLVERPVSEGDWIEVGPVSGIVKSISVRSTRIQTFDRSDVIVPNLDLISRQVTNWTRFSLSGRIIVPVTATLDADTRKIEAILREIAEAQPQAVMNPPPMVLFTGFAGEAMTFEIRLILRDVNQSPLVRSEINHAIAARFAEAGIDMTHLARDFRRAAAGEAAAAPPVPPALAPLLAARKAAPPRRRSDPQDKPEDPSA